LLAALCIAGPASASFYRQSNLVSDLPGEAAVLDPNLVNPWGIAFSPTSPFWVSDNHTGLSTLYNTTGQPQSLVVTIAPPAGGTPPAAPTGIVFNSTAFFNVGQDLPAKFIFSTEDGTISGWNSTANPTNSILEVDNSGAGAIYKGLAIGNGTSDPRIYATNFHAGTVETYDGTFGPALFGAFVDPNIPAGYAPFGIRDLGGNLIVTYAMQDAEGHDDVPGAGHGFVDVYNYDGVLQRRLITQGQLNSPWGLAIAPSDFGTFSNDLLVGNFGDGTVNAFDPTTGAFIGVLSDSLGHAVVNPGLWGLVFGNGGNGGNTNILYFTAGIPGSGSVEDHGLFGQIESVENQTPVFYESFDATVVDDGVLLRWSTSSDIGPLAFDVYRDDGTGSSKLTGTPVNGVASNYEYRDRAAVPGSHYAYEIEPIGVSGGSERYGPIRVDVPMPNHFSLRVSPTPAAGAMTAAFSLPRAGGVRLSIFDVTGREVAVLAQQSYPAGTHEVVWNGLDGTGRALPGGMYYMRIQAPSGEKTARVAILR
jgi:uncharacterized protein (TIGR03118 family)